MTLTAGQKAEILCGIETLAKAVSKCAHDHGWWDTEDGQRNMGEMIALMHSELSEALESHRNKEPMLWYRYDGHDGTYETASLPMICGRLGKPEGIASEFADVIIRILDTCETLDIPLVDALIRKHEYNLTRPHKHGDKAY